MNKTAQRLTWLLCASLLAACASAPPPPDWKMNAQSALESFEKAWLDGDSTLAALNFSRAQGELARTARPDHLERAELIRCAIETAAVERNHCTALETLASQATQKEDRTYAQFLAGKWTDMDLKTLPAQYTALVGAKNDTTRATLLAKIEAPQSRLIAAGVLFQQATLPPAGIEMAINTASEQGWRRPLLAWLKIALEGARQSGNSQAAEKLQQRIDLLLTSMPRSK